MTSLHPPKYSAVAGLPALTVIEGEITARYLVAKGDVDRGAAKLIAEAMGYGVGQVTDRNGLRIAPCCDMPHIARRSRITHVLSEGVVETDWGYVDIAIPADAIDFSICGFAGLMSLFGGDIFGAPYVHDGLILHDIVLTEATCSVFSGPRFGSSEVLRRCDVTQSGIVLALLLKPDMGMSPEYYGDIAEAAAQGGIDYIKEDELTLDSTACRRLTRVESVRKRLTVSGREPLYAANADSVKNLL